MTITRAALVGIFFAFAGAPLAARAEDNACTIATKGDSPVAAACKKGGRKEAEETMEGLVKAAKAKGVKFKCKGCHEDMDNFKLKDNAGEDFKKLLAAAK